MSNVVPTTVSSQLKSANAKSDIENHSGKKNRGKFKHANEEIDQSRSHLNVEYDMYNPEELLHKHYDELIEKHNKNNNSEARRWDLEKYLATFEGKTVKIAGKETKNERWATASQISYFGSKDTLNPVLEEIMKRGASQEEVVNAYSEGYREYIEGHNERFPTLPIYHSDIHFDETTPHGHDAIVVMGHTKKGRPSDSLNNALGEIYGYKDSFKGKQVNMQLYRDENDTIIFNSIAPKLKSLAKKYGLDIEFEPTRLGEEGSLSVDEYKHKKDQERRENELNEQENRVNMRTKAQKKINEQQKEHNRELNKREKDVKAKEMAVQEQQKELEQQQALQIARDELLEEREKKLSIEKRKFQNTKNAVQAMFLAVSQYSKAPYDRKLRAHVAEKGIESVDPKQLIKTMEYSIVDAIESKKEKALQESVYRSTTPYRQKSQQRKSTIREIEIEDDGPAYG